MIFMYATYTIKNNFKKKSEGGLDNNKMFVDLLLFITMKTIFYQIFINVFQKYVKNI